MNGEATGEVTRRPELTRPPTEDSSVGASCTTTSLFELDEPTPLGFSAADVLAKAGGHFQVPMLWVSMCREESYPCNPTGLCDSRVFPRSALAGTETTLSIEIAARDSRVEVSFRTPAEPPCGESMYIPVTLRVETADGALDEVFEGYIVDANLESRHAVTGALRGVKSLRGSLARDSAMPDDAELRLAMGFYDEKAWMQIMVLAGRSELWSSVSLLSSLLPPFHTCAIDVPREDIIAR